MMEVPTNMVTVSASFTLTVGGQERSWSTVLSIQQHRAEDIVHTADICWGQTREQVKLFFENAKEEN